MGALLHTQYLVLAKRPYQESALLLSGISPDCGRLELIAHGARKIEGKKMPVADLYRELEIEYQTGSSELGNLKDAELLMDHAAMAEYPKHFLFAGKAAAFVLENSVPEMPLPLVYDTLRNIFVRLGEPPETEGTWSMVQCSVLLKSTFLYESGLLPEMVSEKQNAFLEELIDAAVNNSALPACPGPYWGSLNQWLNQLLDFHNLPRP